jgi:acyl-CoA reductase-like NAD-dependent aldehyde dehydrogenase
VFNPSQKCRLSSDEVFGPVVAVYPFAEIEQAVELANSVDFAFQASLFTRDLKVAMEMARRLEGLTVLVNDHPAFRVDWMPFGGYKKSGLGVGGIGFTIREMTLEKMIVFKNEP